MNSPEFPDSCPFCGSVMSVLADGKPCRDDGGAWVHFECLTSLHRDQDPRRCQSRWCEQAERQRLTNEVDTLRTANAGLVEKVKRLEKAGDRLVDWLRCDMNPCSVKRSIDQWDKAKGHP